jgi:hypothetical protein
MQSSYEKSLFVTMNARMITTVGHYERDSLTCESKRAYGIPQRFGEGTQGERQQVATKGITRELCVYASASSKTFFNRLLTYQDNSTEVIKGKEPQEACAPSSQSAG